MAPFLQAVCTVAASTLTGDSVSARRAELIAAKTDYGAANSFVNVSLLERSRESTFPD